MSKDVLEVLSIGQAARIDRIKDYHSQSVRSATDHRDASILCAFELSVLKATTPHGSFGALRERYFPALSERMCQYYLSGFRRLSAKSELISDLHETAVKTPILTLPDADQPKLLAEVYKFSDAGTATELLRASGALREPEKQKHTPIKLTPEETLQATLNHAADLFHDARGAIDILFEDESIFAKVPAADRNALLASALRLTKKLRTYKSSRSSRRESAQTKNRGTK